MEFKEVGVSDENKPVESGEKLVGSQEIDNVLQRLPASFRWPKPNADAVAAAVEAIQRMSGGAAVAQDLASLTDAHEVSDNCAACGGTLPTAARFCVWCGASRDGGPAPNQQHVHHHYHHIVPAQNASSAVPVTEAESTAPRGRAPGSPGPAPGGRSEIAARQVAQDWAQACNTRHIDDLLELYAADATLIRSSVPPVRSLPAIREFLASLLEAGLGEVEMESLRLEVMGEIAMDIGRCKMLVPVAMGKRREERGKYLLVLVRQPVGTWKILADSWSSDVPVAAPPEAAPRKGDPAPQPQKRH
jgi:ketosteroid isomerase-like protein